jgi:uncharacterized protein YjbI with pentapeptide repeats
LSHAALQGADLSPATVPGFPPGVLPKIPTNLTDADLGDAALQSANLSRADLTNADLTDANLTGADLTNAVLRDTTLSGALLSGADLRGATELTNEELEQQASSLKGATMPNGQKYEDWLKDKEGSREDGGERGPS